MRRPILLLAILALLVMVTIAWFPRAGSERAETLRSALRGADRLTVSSVEHAESPQAVSISGAEKIAQLVEQLDFNDAESGFHCMCLGDTEIAFFQGDRQLGVLSHHHGKSLRWQGGKWAEDSLFTPESAESWRRWFKEHGEPRFEDVHQREVARAERKSGVDARFLAEFPSEARHLFDAEDEEGMRAFVAQNTAERPLKSLSVRAQKLVAVFRERAELGLAVARGLGSLSVVDGSGGSWSSSTSRDQLALECGRSLAAEELLAVADSNDVTAQVGAARLFFFEEMDQTLPPDQRGPVAARLAEATLRADLAGNGDIAIRRLGKYPCPETIDFLERLAGGMVPYHEADPKFKDEPSPRAAACLILAQTDSRDLAKRLADLEHLPLDTLDRAALRVARSFCGEKGLLNASIFEIESYTIGFGALLALEREGGTTAIDAVIHGGTKHSWAAVRAEAVLTAERMTGQKWVTGGSKDRADFHDEEVREWWTNARKAQAD